jgi:hypothetical protein
MPASRTKATAGCRWRVPLPIRARGFQHSSASARSWHPGPHAGRVTARRPESCPFPLVGPAVGRCGPDVRDPADPIAEMHACSPPWSMVAQGAVRRPSRRSRSDTNADGSDVVGVVPRLTLGCHEGQGGADLVRHGIPVPGRPRRAHRDRRGRVPPAPAWHLPGLARDLAGEFDAASLFVLSSRRESMPMVLIEAIAAGLPVVALDCPTGPAALLGGGRFGAGAVAAAPPTARCLPAGPRDRTRVGPWSRSAKRAHRARTLC